MTATGSGGLSPSIWPQSATPADARAPVVAVFPEVTAWAVHVGYVMWNADTGTVGRSRVCPAAEAGRALAATPADPRSALRRLPGG